MIDYRAIPRFYRTLSGLLPLAAGLLVLGAAPFAGLGAEPAADAVVATVNGQPVPAGEVQAAVAKSIEGRRVEGDSLRQLEAEALDQLIDRQLIEERLSRDAAGVKPANVDAAIARLEAEATEHKTTLEKHLAERRTTLAAFRKQLAFQMGWKEFAQKQLNEAALKAFFQAHQDEFDGTERRVSHIIFRSDRSGDPTATARLVAEANAVREKIETGKISFKDAAVKYSAGPSRHQGGDLGFIPRRGLMDESFSQAAFSLPKGELSQPVVTQFGVHLMRVTEVKRGSKSWEDVRPDVLDPAAAELYEKLAAHERKTAKISYSGAMPHFMPGTRQLAPADKH